MDESQRNDVIEEYAAEIPSKFNSDFYSSRFKANLLHKKKRFINISGQ
jgi:hypothetical protein